MIDGSDDQVMRVVRKVHKFTIEQRQQMVTESFVTGASVREVAARYGVHANQLSTWRTEFRKHSAAPTSKSVRFAAVQSAARVSAPLNEGVIEIDVANACVRIRGEVDASMLSQAVELMR